MTINGLLTVKPANAPTVGQIKTFTWRERTGKSGKPYLKVKSETPEYGGQPCKILQAEQTGFTDPHGNVSWNVELEPQGMEQRDAPRKLHDAPDYPRNAPQSPQIDPEMRFGVKAASLPQSVQDHANRAGDVFDAAWARAGKSMETLMPLKDAQDMKLEMYYDIKMRLAQFIAIQTDRKM